MAGRRQELQRLVAAGVLALVMSGLPGTSYAQARDGTYLGIVDTRDRIFANSARFTIGNGTMSGIVLLVVHADPGCLSIVADFRPAQGVASANSFKVPLLYLVQLKPGATDLKLGMLLLVAAAAIAIPDRRSLRQGAAGAVIGVCCLFLIQLQRQLGQATDAPSIASVAGIGVLTAAAGAALALLWKPAKATFSGSRVRP